MGYASGNFSYFERQMQKGSTATDYNAVDDIVVPHRVMMEAEPLPPQQLLQKQGNDCGFSTLLRTKGRRVEM